RWGCRRRRRLCFRDRPSLVVTLGPLALFRGLAYVVLGDQAVSNFPTAFTNLGFGTIPGTELPWS
ncbi:MAG TPA: hypothetical protein DHV65_19040, partial [Ktedonobacter sp.]|nr:hypothetical protein [Ktedonobacter sp.]